MEPKRNPYYPGLQVYFYRGIIVIPKGCSLVYIGTSDCCRSAAISNISNSSTTDCAIQAIINNATDSAGQRLYANNSVSFNQTVIPACVGAPFVYNPGAVDVDGDSLVFKLSAPLQGSTLPYSPITFGTNWSILNPVRNSNGFTFNSHTGQMTFTPTNTEQDVVAFTVEEYRTECWLDQQCETYNLLL